MKWFGNFTPSSKQPMDDRIGVVNLIPGSRIDSEFCYMTKPANGRPKMNMMEQQGKTVWKDKAGSAR